MKINDISFNLRIKIIVNKQRLFLISQLNLLFLIIFCSGNKHAMNNILRVLSHLRKNLGVQRIHFNSVKNEFKKYIQQYSVSNVAVILYG